MLHKALELISLFNKYGVKYLIIGGYAVNLYGYLRMTEDIDILFKPDKSNGKKILDALQDAGFDIDELKDHDFSSATHLRLGKYPNTIDLINVTAGADMNKIFENGNIFNIMEVPVMVVNLDDLIKMKTALNTYKDLADAEELKKIKDKRS